jgi:hypothetical protein
MSSDTGHCYTIRQLYNIRSTTKVNDSTLPPRSLKTLQRCQVRALGILAQEASRTVSRTASRYPCLAYVYSLSGLLRSIFVLNGLRSFIIRLAIASAVFPVLSANSVLAIMSTLFYLRCQREARRPQPPVSPIRPTPPRFCHAVLILARVFVTVT